MTEGFEQQLPGQDESKKELANPKEEKIIKNESAPDLPGELNISPDEFTMEANKLIDEFVSFLKLQGINKPTLRIRDSRDDEMKKKFGLAGAGSSYYNGNSDEIVIDITDTRLGLGEHLGEELMHAIRHKTRKGWHKENKKVAEFFGFIGRRIVEKMSNSNPLWNNRIFKSSPGTSFANMGNKRTLAEVVRKIRKTEDKFNHEIERATPLAQDDSQMELDKMLSRILAESNTSRLQSLRRSLIAHYRGYEWAVKFDIDKVSNWEKLLKMTDRQIIRNFFRLDADYGILKS